jgi:hypothetical protein
MRCVVAYPQRPRTDKLAAGCTAADADSQVRRRGAAAETSCTIDVAGEAPAARITALNSATATDAPQQARSPITRAFGHVGPVTLLFTALTLVFTWPLGQLSQPQLPAHDDALFSVWRLAWIARQLTVDPASLFDANIFWPARDTLAYSDAMLLIGALGAPFIWLGVHPVIVHNILVLSAFVSAGAAAARAMRYFTPSVPAQLVAGTIFAFAPYRFAHVGHLELLWTAFMPLALIGVYRVLEAPTVRRGLALGLAVGLQALCSVYYFLFLLVWLVPATVLAPLHVRIQWSRRHVVAGAIAVFTAALLVAPYIGPYSRARDQLPPRSETEVARYSAVPTDYLRASTSNRLYPLFPSESPDERSLFVGTIALTLAAIALVLVRTRATVSLGLLALAAIDLSFGVNGITFPLLRDAVPSLASFRAPARFGVLTLLSVALLAGLGLAQTLARATSRRRQVVGALVIAGLALEYWSAPIATRPMWTEPPPVYAWLAEQPSSVVLELPLPTTQTLWHHETSHQYNSIFHWQRLVNGYSGYAPASYLHLLEAMRAFPSDSTMALLRKHQVSVVIFHRRYLEPDELLRLLAACKNPQWFTDVISFPEPSEWGSVACRVNSGG